jgi:hypothetical protein
MSTRAKPVYLTPGEARAVLAATSQMTDGNARSYREWALCVHGTWKEWQALLRAEAKISQAA